jgi:hypothetical protein
MRLAPPLLAAAAAALALAAPAAAKELAKAELCGAAGCVAVTDRDDLRNFPTGGEATTERPPLSSFYALRMSTKDDVATHTWTIYYVPSADLFAIPDEYGSVTWHPLFGDAIPLMRKLASRVEPYPAPEITSVAIGDRVVREDAASYLRLFEPEVGASPGKAAPADWVPVDFRSAQVSPWTLGDRELMYSPSANVLERRTDRLLLAESLAADIEAARPLSADETTSWLPWLALAGLFAALLFLAGFGALLRRRFAAPPLPEPTG